MERDRKALLVMLVVLCGMGGSLLLLGMTLFQAVILASWQGMPPIWQQAIFFSLLLLAGGLALGRLCSSKFQMCGGPG